PDRRAEKSSFTSRRGNVQERGQNRELLSSQFRWLLAARWWLAFFQGLTQAVIFKFSVDQLKIGLEEYYLLSSMMLVVQILTSLWAGRLCDRSHDRLILIWSF